MILNLLPWRSIFFLCFFFAFENLIRPKTFWRVFIDSSFFELFEGQKSIIILNIQVVCGV